RDPALPRDRRGAAQDLRGGGPEPQLARLHALRDGAAAPEEPRALPADLRRPRLRAEPLPGLLLDPRRRQVDPAPPRALPRLPALPPRAQGPGAGPADHPREGPVLHLEGGRGRPLRRQLAARGDQPREGAARRAGGRRDAPDAGAPARGELPHHEAFPRGLPQEGRRAARPGPGAADSAVTSLRTRDGRARVEGRRRKRLDERNTLAPNQKMNRGLARHSAGTDTTRSRTGVGRRMHGSVPRPFSPPPFDHRSRPSRDDAKLLP